MNTKKYGSLVIKSDSCLQEVPEESYQELTDDENDLQNQGQIISEKEIRLEKILSKLNKIL